MKNIIACTLIVILFANNSSVYAQKKPQLVYFDNPEFLSAPKGYSHIAKIDMGNAWMLIISGQVSLDKAGNLVGKGDFARQTEQVYENIMQIIKIAGGNKDHLVKTGIFILDNANMPILREVRNKYINIKNPPASTLVQVAKLYRDDLLIEIEATAVIPKK
jgi:enamine deaminase RidA (YjgF/YER057c/UK114 family)